MNGRVVTCLLLFVLGIALMFVGVLCPPSGWLTVSVIVAGLLMSLLSAGQAGVFWRGQ